MENLVIYLACGRSHTLWARRSILSLIESGYDGKIKILTNHPEELEGIDVYIVEVEGETNFDNRQYKTSIIEYSDAEYNLFLDADTLIHSNIDGIWKHLDFANLSFTPQLGTINYPNYNSGVFLFKHNDETKAFFALWNKLWIELGCKRDEPALAKALEQSKIEVELLDSKYNSMNGGVIQHFTNQNKYYPPKN